MLDFYGNFRTRTFSNIFPDYATFNTFYMQSGYPITIDSTLTDYNLNTIFILLTTKYADSHIKSSDENLFKLRVMEKVYIYGREWQKGMKINSKFEEMTDENILKGPKAIYNNAQNPGSAPSTATLSELTYIDSQSTTNYIKNAPDAYNEARDAIRTEITERFINRFKELFIDITYPDAPLLYKEE